MSHDDDVLDIAHELHKAWKHDPDGHVHYADHLDLELRKRLAEPRKIELAVQWVRRLRAESIARSCCEDPEVQEHRKGGFAHVYKVVDKTWNRKLFALKVLKLEHCLNGWIVERFQREHQLLERLSFKFLPKLRQAGVAGRQHFYLVEFGDRSLDECAAEFTDLPRLLTFALDLLEVLIYLKAEGITHRDIKPGNILVVNQMIEGRRRLCPKLIDFGIATDAYSAAGETPSDDRPLGTKYFSAPEVLARAACDYRADLYSFGRVISDLLEGRIAAPHVEAKSALSNTPQVRGDRTAEMEILALPPVTLDRHASCDHGITTALKELLKRCHAEDPAHRPHDLLGVHAELRRLLAACAAPDAWISSPRTPPGLAQDMPTAPAEAMTPAPLNDAMATAKARWTRLLAVLVPILLFIIALLCFVLVKMKIELTNFERSSSRTLLQRYGERTPTRPC